MTQLVSPERQFAVAGIEASYTALLITDPNLSFEDFRSVCIAAARLKTATSWWIGDLILAGEKLFPDDMYVLAIEATGLAYDTLTNYVSVCKKVARSRRREELGFGHHAEVAKLEPPLQVEWLEAAVVNGWLRSELRDRLRASTQAPKPEEQPRWSKDEPASTEPLNAEQVEDAEKRARQTLEKRLPAGHPLHETLAESHARDVIALAATAKVSLREAAARLVANAKPNGTGVWVPLEVFEQVAAALAEEE